MTSIQDEVRLFEGQRVCLCRRPLLKYLIANGPHEDGGMVAVAKDQVGKVALMPLIEETGIVVLRLLAAPHIKRLVHDDDSHRVTHVQQFWCRGIM